MVRCMQHNSRRFPQQVRVKQKLAEATKSTTLVATRPNTQNVSPQHAQLCVPYISPMLTLAAVCTSSSTQLNLQANGSHLPYGDNTSRVMSAETTNTTMPFWK